MNREYRSLWTSLFYHLLLISEIFTFVLKTKNTKLYVASSEDLFVI